MTGWRLHSLWLVPSAAVAAGATWALRTWDPNLPGNPFFACVFHQATGLFCPGCGGTRAMHALVHFDVARAIEMNVLPFVIAPLLVVLAARLNAWLPASLERSTRFVTNGWFWAALVVGFGVVRNLPFAAVSWMAPG